MVECTCFYSWSLCLQRAIQLINDVNLVYNKTMDSVEVRSDCCSNSKYPLLFTSVQLASFAPENILIVFLCYMALASGVYLQYLQLAT